MFGLVEIHGWWLWLWGLLFVLNQAATVESPSLRKVAVKKLSYFEMPPVLDGCGGGRV
jgi:hypothetical protein